MVTMKVEYGCTFFSLLVVGLWLFLGFLFRICSILLDSNGRRLCKIFVIGRIGFFAEVELELRKKKARKPCGMRNWLFFWNMDTLETDITPEEHNLIITNVRFRPNSIGIFFIRYISATLGCC